MSTSFPSLVQSLRSPERQERFQALLSLKESGDAGLFDALLEGVTVQAKFSMGRHFQGSPLDVHWDVEYQSLVAALLVLAPPDCAVAGALAAEVTQLDPGYDFPQSLPLGDGAALEKFQAATEIRLTTFVLDDLSVFSRLPALRSLSLRNGKIPDGLPGLSLGPSVEGLEIGRCSLTDARGLSAPGLQDLNLRGNDFVSLEHLPELPALRGLYFPDCESLRSLRGLERFSQLTQLFFSGCNALKSLSGLPASENLTRLHSLPLSLPGLEDLAGLPELPKVTELELADLASLERLEGIERLPHLRRLTMQGVQKSIDLAPLTRLAKLEVLDLRKSPGITSISALDEMSSLRVLLWESGVPRRAVRADLRWRCSWAGNPNVRLLLQQSPPPEKPASVRSKMDRDSRTSLASLRRLLASGEADAIEQGLEMLKALSDASLYDALLEGAEYVYAVNKGHQMSSPKFTGPLRATILHRLLAEAPPESALASTFKEKIRELDFVDLTRAARLRTPTPFDLTLLTALPNLGRLTFRRVGPLSASDGLALAALWSLTLDEISGDLPLGWLSRSPRLAHLELHGRGASFADLSFASGLPRLTRFSLDAPAPRSLEPLSGLTALAHVSLVNCSGLTTLDGLGRSLQSLDLRYCSSLTSLGPVLDAPALERLKILGCKAIPKTELSALEARGVTVEQRK